MASTRGWIAANRRLLSTIVSGTLVIALVATAAVLSGGYEAKRVDLDDGAVWVANSDEGLVGRVSTRVLALDTVVEAPLTDASIVQQGTTVLVADRAEARLDVLDVATATIAESMPLPPDSAEVLLTGGTLAVLAAGTGELWFHPVTDLAGFDPAVDAALTFGEGARAATGAPGEIVVFAPQTGSVHRVDAASGSVLETFRVQVGEADDDRSLAVVDGVWTLLDPSRRELTLPGGVTALGPAALAGGLRLQRSGGSDGRVLVAHSGGLLSVSTDGGDVRTEFDGASGLPADPVVVDGCRFAAWSDGTVWRRCGDGDPDTLSLGRVGARLQFAVNGRHAVLTDAASGMSWAVQEQGQPIANWQELAPVDDTRQLPIVSDEDVPPVLEREQRPPVAVNDAFGARPSRTSPLPVLLNDHDPNGDVLIITGFEQLDESIGRIELVSQHQQLQVTLTAAAQGEITFGYTVGDGRGGVAAATVTVTVRRDDENGPPAQQRTSRTTVEAGGRLTTNALVDWVDPDGDAMFLAAASVAEPDTVTHRPDGSLVFTERGGAGTTRTVALVASDGTAQGAGALVVTVHAAAVVPLIADPFVVLATAGATITVEPLEHVRGGSGPVRLNAVPDKAGARITPSLEQGTFTFSSSEVRTHYLEYVVADARQTTTGVIRVEVVAPPDANTRPIAVPKTVFIHTLSSESVDLAATAIDPAGGVLLVTEVADVPTAAGVRAEVLEQRIVRITLTAPLEPAIATFSYRVTNGLADAVGIVTVVEIPRPARLQPPVAVDDSVNVRVGAAVDIPVLANDFHPDGEALTLDPDLVRDVPDDSGLLFVSGSRLRYLAPDTPGVYSAVYAITGPSGQQAQAQVTISVRESVEATNNPPAPATVTARVFAGERVRIKIPLNVIDPDGDTVTLIGQDSGPQKGTVVEADSESFVYEAGGYSAGTDSFTYVVIDGLGARATGLVRIGIAPPLELLPNPLAVEDEVQTRPGRSVLVRVLDNDSDPSGRTLTVAGVEPADDETQAVIVDGTMVRVTPPARPGRYGMVVTIENSHGGQSANFLTVIVAEDAPLSRPVARDIALSLSDVLDRASVDVDVLADVFFADGDARSLDLALLPGFSEGAEITANRLIRVAVSNQSQIIPFAVVHPDDPSIRGYAFIRVPGFDDALPQLDRTAEPLTVVSEQTLRIELSERVIAVGGRSVRITDRAAVRATNANGDDLVVDDDTLEFTSADLYYGPASITVEVTDGAGADDPNGRRAVLVLPITVTPRENQPPVFGGGLVEFEPGQTREFDLVRLTTYPYPEDADELAYSVLDPQPVGFTWRLEAQTLFVTASSSTPKGTAAALSLGVRDGASAGTPGRLRLQVVPSTRPLARPAPDSAITRRGSTTVVDVLANDAATNPFPGEPLTVTAIRGLDGAGLPAGVQLSPSADRSRITVTVAQTAQPADVSLQYQVADATLDPDRRAWGTITISIQDVPDAPAAPVRASNGVEEGQLTLSITAPQFNNSPIIRYEVTSSSHGDYRHDCGLVLRCALTDLTPGLRYQFSVTAINAIGPSAPSPLSALLGADYLPAAPASVRATPTDDAPTGGSVDIAWTAVPDPSPGSPVSGYTVVASGADGSTVTRDVSRTTTALSMVLKPDVPYTVSVYARNAAQVGDGDWKRTSVSVRPVGIPGATVPAPAAATLADGSGHIVVTWGASSPNGAPSVQYSVGRFDVGATLPTACVAGPGKPGQRSPEAVASGWIDTTAVDGGQYRYVVYADNGLYCSVSTSGPVESKRPPGAASGTVTVEAHDDSGQFDVRVVSLAVASGAAARYEASIGGGAWFPVAEGQWLTSAADMRAYGVAQLIRFRGCRDAGPDFCGPESETVTATPVNTRVVAMTTCTPGAPPLAQAPRNDGPVEAVRFAFAYDTEPGGAYTAFSFGELDPVPSDATRVRVRATVTVGGVERTDPLYGGEFACQ